MPTWSRVTSFLRSQLPLDVVRVFDVCERDGRTESPDYQAATIEFYRRHLCRAAQFPPELLAAFAAMAEDSTVYNTMNGPSEFRTTGTLATWSIVDDLHLITERTVPGGILLINGRYDEAQDECVMPYFTHTRARVKVSHRPATGRHFLKSFSMLTKPHDDHTVGAVCSQLAHAMA